MNRRDVRFLMSFVVTLLIMIIIVMITSSTDEGMFHRIMVMLGGSMPTGVIQGFTLLLFIFGILEVVAIDSKLTKESDALRLGMLPEKENWVIDADDAVKIRCQLSKYEGEKGYLVADLIRKSCTKYRLNKSSSEVLQLVETQIKTYQMDSESEQSILRYVVWAIPSVGFIGTVLGIAASLGLASEAGSSEGIKSVTDMLSVAFDTTLVALVYSLVLMYLVHMIQERENRYFVKLSNYLIENLINRFYK